VRKAIPSFSQRVHPNLSNDTKETIMNRLPVIATVAAGLLIAGLPPAVAGAAPGPGCENWGFNDHNVFPITPDNSA
jgi:hypothetical protein